MILYLATEQVKRFCTICKETHEYVLFMSSVRKASPLCQASHKRRASRRLCTSEAHRSRGGHRSRLRGSALRRRAAKAARGQLLRRDRHRLLPRASRAQSAGCRPLSMVCFPCYHAASA